jgi:uncharacterized ion transporter superfamily protein YfcC
MTEQIHRTKINKSNDRTNTQNEDKQVSVIRLVYLRSVYLFCHLTCLSSLCVLVLSFDLFIFALCICSVIWLVYRAKINKSNDRTNTQSEDKQVKWQNKYTERRKTSQICHSTCLSPFCVFFLSFDLFIFALCISSVIWLVYLRSVYLFCNCQMTEQIHRAKINKSNDRTNTQKEEKQVKWQNKYTERR